MEDPCGDKLTEYYLTRAIIFVIKDYIFSDDYLSSFY